MRAAPLGREELLAAAPRSSLRAIGVVAGCAVVVGLLLGGWTVARAEHGRQAVGETHAVQQLAREVALEQERTGDPGDQPDAAPVLVLAPAPSPAPYYAWQVTMITLAALTVAFAVMVAVLGVAARFSLWWGSNAAERPVDRKVYLRDSVVVIGGLIAAVAATAVVDLVFEPERPAVGTAVVRTSGTE